MNKAILVVNMPKTCNDCPIMFRGDYSYWCPWKDARTDVYDYIVNNTKPDWCPLCEMPERYEIDKSKADRDYEFEYEYGYNACINEILKE